MLDDDYAEEYADDDAPSGDEYVVADDAAEPQTVDAAAETDAVFALATHCSLHACAGRSLRQPGQPVASTMYTTPRKCLL